MRTTSEQMNTQPKVYVWDIVVRVFHWTTAVCFVMAYLLEDNRDAHKFFGYVLMTGLIVRLVWGVVGTFHAKFWNFIPSPPKVIRYFIAMLRGKESRYIGHNPAGALMIVALIFALGTISATGWMMGLDRYWGEEAVENLHIQAVNGTFALIAIHISGVIYSSIKHRENLVRAMLTGWKNL